MSAEPPQVFFRLIQAERAVLRDVLSHEALGTPPRRPLSRRERERWRGLSAHDSLEAARVKGTDSPWLGRFIAELHIPPDAAIRIEQTGRDPSHYTIWAEAADLLSWIVSIHPVKPVD